MRIQAGVTTKHLALTNVLGPHTSEYRSGYEQDFDQILANPFALESMLHMGCSCLPVVFFLSPVTVFWPAWWQNKRVQLPPLHLCAQLTQCFVWLIYALDVTTAAGKTGDVTMIIPNAIGISLGLVWLVLYSGFYSPELYRRQFFAELAMTMLICITVCLIHTHHVTIGYIGMCAGLCMLASPAFVTWKVWQTKNLALMGSLTMNLVGLMTTTCWSTRAFLIMGEAEGFPVAVQNVSGFVANLVALTLRVTYRNEVPATVEECPLDDHLLQGGDEVLIAAEHT